jgi:hypothetical protein
MTGGAGAMGAGRPLRRAREWPVQLALGLVVGLIFAVAWSEEAHAVSNTERFRFSSEDLCIREKSLTYVWSQDGALYGQSVTRPFSGDCSSWLSAPPGYVSGRAIVWKWSGFYGDWFVCRDTGWHYNADRTSRLVLYRWLGYQSNRWCGSGWYGTEAQGSVWRNGAWRTTPRSWSGSAFYY